MGDPERSGVAAVCATTSFSAGTEHGFRARLDVRRTGAADAGSMHIATHSKPLTRLVLALTLCLSVLGETGVARAAVRPDSWQPAGALGTGRALPTATTLPDGRVLVAGGQTGFPLAATSGAELFDPSTATWTPTGALTVARAGQTASPLRNGKVLIVGGASGADIAAGLRSAELYDPARGTFAPTRGAPTAAHGWGVAEPLPDGRVLIAGGFDAADEPTAATDVYDPATDTFTSGPPLATARAEAVGVVVGGGRVLVAGGIGGGAALASAEVYDPVAGAWTAVDDALSDGRVAAQAAPLPGGRALIAGGKGATLAPLASTDVYDPATNRFSASAPLSVGHDLAVAAPLPGGRVLVAGGGSGSDGGNGIPVIAGAEIYDPATDAWAAAAPLATPRVAAGVAVLQDGSVLVAGGVTDAGGGITRSAETYVPVGVPAAPVAVAATAGDGTAAVTWAPPASDGGAPVQRYVVVASPGGARVTTPDARTFATVGGLQNGRTYTFTVHAVNAIGDGPDSVASDPLTPTAPIVPGTPAAAPPAPAATTPVPRPAPHLELRGFPRHITRSTLLRGLRFEVVAGAPLHTTARLTAGHRVLARRALALHTGTQQVRLVAARPPRARRFTVAVTIGSAGRHLLVRREPRAAG
jgi:hypothetical protein